MNRLTNWLRIIFWSSGIIFLWMGSAAFLMRVLSRKPAPGAVPTLSDLATIFFGASSLALIIFSLVVAIAAIIEWQSLKGDVRKEIEAAEIAQENITRAMQQNQERVDNLSDSMLRRIEALKVETERSMRGLEKEVRGRTNAGTGYMIGALNSNPILREQSDEDKDYLGEAIYVLEKAYEDLREVGGTGQYMALNNIVYFSCLLRMDSRKDRLLTQARELKQIGEKFRDRPHIAPYILTFCRAIWTYGSDPSELREALLLAEQLLDTGLTKLKKKEATFLVTSLTGKLAELTDGTT
jgi:hypothetical protein